MSKKSFLVATFVQGLVFLITAWGGWRLWAAWHAMAWLKTLPLQVPPLYLEVSGAVWLVAGFVTWLLLLTEDRWAPQALLATVAAFAVFWWVDRYALPRDAVFLMNRPLWLGITVAVVAAVAVVTAPPVWNSFFGVDDERTFRPQD